MAESTPSHVRATPEKDYLGLQLREMPYFRGLLRAVEAREYPGFGLAHPILDVGCGDGHFVTTAFDERVDVGIDPWGGPVREAVRRGGYRLVIQGSGDWLPFDDGHFASAMSNSVLEHIPDVEAVLVEVARVLQPGAPFVFCVPNHNFLPNLSLARTLDRMGLRGPAGAYRRFFNRISRHHHCDSPEVWTDRLQRAGFSVERWWHYFSPEATRALEWGHYFGLPALVSKKLTGRWILWPSRANLALTHAMLERYYTEPRQQPHGSYTFYIARRLAE
jgi:SAM-dependent methyltransferase